MGWRPLSISCVIALTLGAVGGTATGQGETESLSRFEYKRLVMGTQARLLLWGENEEVALTAARAAFAEMDEIDAHMSDWNPDSELSQMSLHAGGDAVPATPALLEVLDLACEVSRVTGGAFDPTLGPLTKLWRECRESETLPTQQQLEEAIERTGVDLVFVDRAAGTLRLAVPEMELDLGGIAKGFACDRALEVMGTRGVTRALVEIGGDFAAGDPPPGKEGWELATACGTDGAHSPSFRVANQGVATSGDTFQYFEVDGQRYGHVIDPSTGLGATESNCATVIAPTGALADALASVASLPNQAALPRALAQYDARLVTMQPAKKVNSKPTTQQSAPRPGADPKSQDAPRHGDFGAWVPIFDGNTLKGWTTTGGRYDGAAVWSVEDYCLVGHTGENNAGGLIYTEEMYSSFELAMDVWIDYPFDSGVFTNMLPPDTGLKGLQLTLDYRPTGQVGAIYADGFLFENKEGSAKWKRGEWNHVRVRQTGFDRRLRFWLNEELVTDFSMAKDAVGYAPHGRIGLQVHGGGSEGEGNQVKFRGIRIRELPVFDDETLPLHTGPNGMFDFGAPAKEKGWRSMLANDSMDAFDLPGKNVYEVKDGTLSMPANADGGVLRSKDDFKDFRMRLDFVVPYMGNSGVYLRSARDDTNPSYSGAEIQILDDEHWESVTNSTLAPWQFTGSLYGTVPAGKHGRLAANGRWNTYEILVRGDRYAVALNGYILYDVRTSELTPTQGAPFAERAKTGFVGVQTHGPAQARPDDVLAFRNWFIQGQ
ncbi:MAG: thiamine biosynthesis lipoprotein [Planctomycetota bacterium]|jgi:thiamine biosynthesis lipoprotein